VLLTGESGIEYDERILPPNPADGAERALRIYRRIDFRRTLGGQDQESTLRPEVRRLVILRRDRVEVPFSPDGPLTWGEIDLVRTDVFVPALAGLLPQQPVRVGDTWPASPAAVRELTDMEKMEEGRIDCTLDQLTDFSGRPLARVALKGEVRGVNEDGPSRQRLEGMFYFDRQSEHLTYLSLSGVHELLDGEGRVAGRVEGQFVLSRRAHTRPEDLSDEAVRGLELEPNERNTRLLYDNPDLGLRLLYPRHWRAGVLKERQLALDGPHGGGLLLTVEPADRVPVAAQFRAEAEEFLKKYGATDLRAGAPRPLPGAEGAAEHFRIEGKLKGERVAMDYYVLRQRGGGATVAARLPPEGTDVAAREVEQIVRTVTLSAEPGARDSERPDP
ncbi:MAG TPA: hypothetical protein VIL46_09545, partial [Gemmataceae bacterium]